MALDDATHLALPEPAGLERLHPEHFDELRAFYAHDAYRPEERHGRFFESYMLELGPWFGIREAGRLVSVAGVHVVSARTSVAGVGGIATRPDRRGRGLARAVTARLCRELRERVELVGLNVAVANHAAIRCYESLGFRAVSRYEEMELERHPAG
jgi:predicted GNAT family acetyltransferase